MLQSKSVATLDVAYPVSIFVHKVLNGQSLCLRLRLVEHASKVYALVEETTGVLANEWYLTFAGRRLDPHRALSSYGIGNGSTLHLSMRLRGGERDRTILDRIREAGDKSSVLLRPLHDGSCMCCCSRNAANGALVVKVLLHGPCPHKSSSMHACGEPSQCTSCWPSERAPIEKVDHDEDDHDSFEDFSFAFESFWNTQRYAERLQVCSDSFVLPPAWHLDSEFVAVQIHGVDHPRLELCRLRTLIVDMRALRDCITDWTQAPGVSSHSTSPPLHFDAEFVLDKCAERFFGLFENLEIFGIAIDLPFTSSALAGRIHDIAQLAGDSPDVTFALDVWKFVKDLRKAILLLLPDATRCLRNLCGHLGPLLCDDLTSVAEEDFFDLVIDAGGKVEMLLDSFENHLGQLDVSVGVGSDVEDCDVVLNRSDNLCDDDFARFAARTCPVAVSQSSNQSLAGAWAMD
eukprot:TRINITY_DN9301_c0_g1_i4.p1 TRINITY_DN9301_c0_g1~~TRINITY_DN9301_c0_g1_i4.p1  ORF type:complete len:460 (-),score=38.24 TRINITY_DN9301_c0_g1_i4:403-1782(-)